MTAPARGLRLSVVVVLILVAVGGCVDPVAPFRAIPAPTPPTLIPIPRSR